MIILDDLVSELGKGKTQRQKSDQRLNKEVKNATAWNRISAEISKLLDGTFHFRSRNPNDDELKFNYSNHSEYKNVNKEMNEVENYTADMLHKLHIIISYAKFFMYLIIFYAILYPLIIALMAPVIANAFRNEREEQR